MPFSPRFVHPLERLYVGLFARSFARCRAAACALTAAALFAGCAAPAPPAGPSSPGRLPATYLGEIPGAGGPVRWQLDLLDGSRFQLRRTFVGRPAPNAFDAIGRYRLDGPRLTLDGASEAPLFLALRPDGALRKLDTEGRPIDSAQPDLLRRQAAAAPIEPRLRLEGLFTYVADAPRIVLCADGRSLPVQMAGDYLALERAYLAARPAGAPLLAQLEGRIAPLPAAEAGRPPEPTLVVERFERVGPQASCPAVAPDRPLLDTAWRLVWIEGVPYTPALLGRPAELQFQGERASGSDGCNRLFGPYTREGDALRLGELAATMMACPTGLAEARAYRAALARVRHLAVRGELLELLDGEGSLLLRFRAE